MRTSVGFGPPVNGPENLTATGTDQATAFQITAQASVFTTVASGTGCRLPWASGATVSVYNLGVNALLVYPGSGDQIGSGSVNASVSVASGDSATFTSLAAPTSAIPRRWYQQSSGGGGGGSAAGPAGTVQMSDGAGAFVVSDFLDLLTVPGSATVTLADSVSGVFAIPGVAVRGTSGGALSIGPTSSGFGAVVVEGFGAPNATGLTILNANGTRVSPTEILSGDTVNLLSADAYDGTEYDPIMSIRAQAQSDFSGTPTSSFDITNASDLGLHVAADGTFSVDNGIVVGVDTQTAVAGAATTAKPNVIVTSEGLTAATTYALTLTSPFIATTSVVQVTAMNSDGLVTWPVSIACLSGSAVITVGMAALTGTVVMNISVNN